MSSNTRRKPRPTEAVKRLVWTRAAGICAFPDCRRHLIEEAVGDDPAVFLGEVAHIVGHSEDGGPRAGESIPGGDREGEQNLLLLCLEHHTVIDRQEGAYTVERLVAMKAAHEEWVRDVTRVQRVAPAPPLVSELLHSTLLAVDQLPRWVYTAPCEVAEKDVRGRIRYPRDKQVLVPFIVREHKLIAFADLADAQGPFGEVVHEHGAAERHDVAAWLRDEDLARWIVQLLNRAVGRYAARRELRFDREHQRYYFPPEVGVDGRPVERVVQYRPMNQGWSERKVAWNPVRKKTGEGKPYWKHLAVGLRFQRVSPGQWALSLRPEHRFTRDGETPLAPKGIGKRSTSTKSRMYNSDVLTEVHFWRDYLTQSQPRMLLSFGAQSLVIDGALMSAEVRWPGVPDDVVPFANVDVEDDLFSLAEYHRALGDGRQLEVELDEHDLDDLNAIEAAAEDDAVADDDFEEASARVGTTHDADVAAAPDDEEGEG